MQLNSFYFHLFFLLSFFFFLSVYLSRYFVLTMVCLYAPYNKLLIFLKKKHEILARVRVIIVYKLHKYNRNFIKFSLLTWIRSSLA